MAGKVGKPAAKPQGQALPPPPEWCWKLKDIAHAHRMTAGAVRAAIKRGELVAHQSGKDYVVPNSEYRRWLDNTSTRRKEGSLGQSA